MNCASTYHRAAATTMIGPNYWVVPALPQEQLAAILRKHGVLTR